MNSYKYLFKFIIVGDTNVGKSCILLQFTEKRFKKEYEATVAIEFGAKNIEIKDHKIKLQIWDTAGQELFKSITRSYYRGSIGVILVFDVTSRQSFESILKWHEEIQGYTCDQIEIVIVGNKIDLEQKREVSKEEAERFAIKQGFQYFEISAKTGEQVNQVFESIATKVLYKIEHGEIDPKLEIYGIKIGTVGLMRKSTYLKPENENCC